MSIFAKELIDPDSTGDRDTEKRQLLMEALRSGRSIRLRAFGSSMVPTIWPGDTTLVEHTSAENPIGTILLTVRDDRFYMHRLTRVEKCESGIFFVTQGDAMKFSDPGVRPEQILGAVTSVTRQGREIVPRTRLNVFEQVIAYAFCHLATFRKMLLHFHATRVQLYSAMGRASLSHEIPA